MTLAPLPFLGDEPNVSLAGVKGQWMREGACDQCAHGDVRGECCTKVAFPISDTAGHNPDVVRFFQLHGIEVKWWGDKPIAIVPLRCSALTEAGDCSLFGKPERPELCDIGPFNPWAADLNPACSYKFSLVED